MARPEKQGIDYFPYDVDLDQDDKLGMIIGEFQSKGEQLYTKLLCWIYKNNGYYVTWDESVQLRFLRRYDYCGFSVSFINEVVPRFIKWGLFDKTVFDAFQILTSARIQATWLEATRKRIHRKYIPDIWLIGVSSDLTAEETIKPPEETPQKKVNNTKEEETKKNMRAIALGAGDGYSKIFKPEYDKLIDECKDKDRKIIWGCIKDFIVNKKPDFIEPFVDAWNLFAASYKLSKVESISDSRRKKFKTRIGESSFDFLKILEKIKTSSHLKGNNTATWKVTFDWILENDSNYVKILEDNY